MAKTLEIFKSINWAQIFVHLFASLFLFVGFKRLAVLVDFPIYEALVHYQTTGTPLSTYKYHGTGSVALYLIYLRWWTYIAGCLGLITGFIISRKISARLGINRINSVVILIVSFVLFSIKNVRRTFFINKIYLPRSVYPNLLTETIVDGLLLIIIGLMIFYFKGFQRLIEKVQYKSNHKHSTSPSP